MAWAEAPVQLQVSTPDGASFAGEIMPVYHTEENFNGPGCGECTGGAATITVE